MSHDIEGTRCAPDSGGDVGISLEVCGDDRAQVLELFGESVKPYS